MTLPLASYSLRDLSFQCPSRPVTENIEDEFKREEAFMKQALETVIQARKLILAAKVPYHRPAEYFCEMLKTAEHMSRVEHKAKEDKEAAKEVERLRRERMNRKYGKKIQKQREQEKQQQKSEEVKKVMEIRKKKRPLEKEDDEFGIDVEEDDGADKRNAPKKAFAKRPKSEKREHRDTKYGFGGSKRSLKKNSRESVDEDTFDVRKNRAPFRGLGREGKRGGGRQGGKTQRPGKGGQRPGKNAQRPGKQRRQQIRSKKSANK